MRKKCAPFGVKEELDDGSYDGAIRSRGSADSSPAPVVQERRPRTSHKKEVQCLDCHTVWPNRLALARHKKVCGKEDLSSKSGHGLTCPFCSSVWPDERSLKQHLCNCRLRLQQESVNKKQIQCDTCYKYFYDEESYKNHCATSHSLMKEVKEQKKPTVSDNTKFIHTGEVKGEEESDGDQVKEGAPPGIRVRAMTSAERQRAYRARRRAAKSGAKDQTETPAPTETPSPGNHGNTAAKRKSLRSSSGTPAKKVKAESEDLPPLPSMGSVTSARSLSSRRNANATKQCMDCHETLPNALALAQHKRKGCVDVTGLLDPVPVKHERAGDSGELHIALEGPTGGTGSGTGSNGNVTCLDCGKKCADFMALHDHKKGDCPKTYGDITIASKLSRPIHCLNCHEASFKTYLDLHRHQTGECPLTRVRAGPHACEHCAEQFDTMLKYSHHLARCPIRQLLTAADSADDAISSLSGDTYSLAHNFGLDLNAIKQEMVEEEEGQRVQTAGCDDVTENVVMGNDDVITGRDRDVGKSSGTPVNKIADLEKENNTARNETKMDDSLEGIEIKQEKLDDDDDAENLPFGTSLVDDTEEFQCNFCGDEFSDPALYDGHMETCPLRNTMATKDITLPSSSDNSQDGTTATMTSAPVTSPSRRRSTRCAAKKHVMLGDNGDVSDNEGVSDIEDSDEEAVVEDETEDDDISDENDYDDFEPTPSKKGSKGKKSAQSPKGKNVKNKNMKKSNSEFLKVKLTQKRRFEENSEEECEEFGEELQFYPVGVVKEEEMKENAEERRGGVTRDIGTATFAKAIKEKRKIFVLGRDELGGATGGSSATRGSSTTRGSLVTCLDCGFAANNRKLLEKHKKSCERVGLTRVFACFACGNSFYTREELNAHKRNQHGDHLEEKEKILKHGVERLKVSCEESYECECNHEYCVKHTARQKAERNKSEECAHEYCYVCVTCSARFPMKSDCQLHFIEKHPEDIASTRFSFCREQCKRCGVLVTCRHTAVYLCHLCRQKFSTQIGCKMHFYEAHPLELGKQKLPIFTCVERCIKCHLEITVDMPDLAGQSQQQGAEVAKGAVTSESMKSSKVTSRSGKKTSASLETPCENCLMTFRDVDAFLLHLPCSRTLNTGRAMSIRVNKSIAQVRSGGVRNKSSPEAQLAARLHTNKSALEDDAKKPSFQCSICQSTFESKTALLSHKPCFGLQSEDGKYFCLECQEIFPNEVDYLKHKRSSHSSAGSSMTCWDCGQSFTFYVDLSQHRLKVHGSGRKQVIPPGQLKEDNISVVITDRDNNIVEKVTKENIREVIDHKIKVPTNFTEYVGKGPEVQNKVQKCTSCPALFANQSDLAVHVRVAHSATKDAKKAAQLPPLPTLLPKGAIFKPVVAPTATTGKAIPVAGLAGASATTSQVKPVVPMGGTIKLPPGVQLPQGLVMKQGPDGKLCFQTPGVSDYKVSMVTAPDGSFQLKFDKSATVAAPVAQKIAKSTAPVTLAQNIVTMGKTLASTVGKTLASTVVNTGGPQPKFVKSTAAAPVVQVSSASVGKLQTKMGKSATTPTVQVSSTTVGKAQAMFGKGTTIMVPVQTPGTQLSAPLGTVQYKPMMQTSGVVDAHPNKPVFAQVTMVSGTSLLKPVQTSQQNTVTLPGGKSISLLSGQVKGQPNVKVVPAKEKELKIKSVGKVVSLLDGKQVYLPEEKSSGDSGSTEGKSRPNILSRTNRRKSTPRKVMSKVTGNISTHASPSQPINIEPRDDVIDEAEGDSLDVCDDVTGGSPGVNVVYSFRCSGCDEVYASAETWSRHAELCPNWCREIHPIIEVTTAAASDGVPGEEGTGGPRVLGREGSGGRPGETGPSPVGSPVVGAVTGVPDLPFLTEIKSEPDEL